MLPGQPAPKVEPVPSSPSPEKLGFVWLLRSGTPTGGCSAPGSRSSGPTTFRPLGARCRRPGAPGRSARGGRRVGRAPCRRPDRDRRFAWGPAALAGTPAADVRRPAACGAGRRGGRRGCAGLGGPPIYVGGCWSPGLSRFINAGLSVALPHVAPAPAPGRGEHPRRHVGAAVVALGAGDGDRAARVHRLGQCRLGDHHGGRGPRLGAGSVAVAGSGGAVSELGPDRVGRNGQRPPVAVRLGFVDARATLATPSVAASFLALAAHRLAFGISTLLTLLRYAFTDAGMVRAGRGGRGGGGRRSSGWGAAAPPTVAGAPPGPAADDPGRAAGLQLLALAALLSAPTARGGGVRGRGRPGR